MHQVVKKDMDVSTSEFAVVKNDDQMQTYFEKESCWTHCILIGSASGPTGNCF